MVNNHRNMMETIIISILILRLTRIIRGIKREISISKIRKISLIRKNWILKGKRFKAAGSNPHSKGDIFSRLLMSEDFFENIMFNKNSEKAIVKKKKDKFIKEIIIYINL